MITVTLSQAVAAGLVDASTIDPHDFAPHCPHDPWPKTAEPLHCCSVCDPGPVRKVIKRPSVGDTLDWAHGPGRVLEVSGNGQQIRITDRINRRWTITRAPGGHWVRLIPTNA